MICAAKLLLFAFSDPRSVKFIKPHPTRGDPASTKHNGSKPEGQNIPESKV